MLLMAHRTDYFVLLGLDHDGLDHGQLDHLAAENHTGCDLTQVGTALPTLRDACLDHAIGMVHPGTLRSGGKLRF